MKLMLHIGTSKTGSTYIQHFLNENRAELLDQGIYYPEIGQFFQKKRPHKQAGHVLFLHEALNKEKTLLENLKEEIHKLDHYCPVNY